MDQITIRQYDTNAAMYAGRYDQYKPEKLYDIIKLFFKPEGKTADIGCGSGRDAAYLSQCGFSTVGYDAAPGMVREAKARYEKSRYDREAAFSEASLPGLEGIRDGEFTNVLCSAVLMHLPEDEIIYACQNLLRITDTDGTVIVTLRSSLEESEREEDGRLYTRIPPDKLILLFESLGGSLLYRSEDIDVVRPGIVWHTVVVGKG